MAIEYLVTSKTPDKWKLIQLGKKNWELIAAREGEYIFKRKSPILKMPVILGLLKYFGTKSEVLPYRLRSKIRDLYFELTFGPAL